MKEWVRLIEEPRRCPYLCTETASLEYRIVSDLHAEEYEELLARGYRRFGCQLFRPSCPNCSQCISIRYLAGEFRPSASQRRVWRKNGDLRTELRPVSVTERHVALFNRYQRHMVEHRNWEQDSITLSEYIQSFVIGGGSFAWQWMFFEGKRLIGVALMDRTAQAVSMVYTYYEPDCRGRSLGSLAILTQLDYARREGLRFAYPGYWIAGNTSMAYKARFRPYERLTSYPRDGEAPRWQAVSPGSALATGCVSTL